MALVFAPNFFNLERAQHFEADKSVGIRVLAIDGLAIEGLRMARRTPLRGALRKATAALRRGVRQPLLLGVTLLVLSMALSTALSMAPRFSVWGSYERRQGALTLLSYVTLFAIAAARLSAVRVERMMTVTSQTAIAVSLYALAQAAGLAPIEWAIGDVARRPTSTFGNAGALAGYLAVTAPFVGVRMSRAWRALSEERAASAQGSRDAARVLALLGTHAFLLVNVAFSARSLGWVGDPVRFVVAIAVVASAWALRDAPSTVDLRRFGRAVMLLGACWIVLTCASAMARRTQLGLGLGLCAMLALAPIMLWAVREAKGLRLTRALEARRVTQLALLGYGVGLAVCGVIVVLTQARGAQAALLVGLLVLWTFRRARAARGRWGSLRLLAVKIGGQALLVVALQVFNLSQHPLVQRARAIPYVGRFGQWLAVGSGTGHERLLIWRGDAYGSGMVGLIFARPLRALLGHGPDTLKERFASVFPPSLLEGTGHNLTPDRAHDVALDMLYAQGARTARGRQRATSFGRGPIFAGRSRPRCSSSPYVGRAETP